MIQQGTTVVTLTEQTTTIKTVLNTSLGTPTITEQSTAGSSVSNPNISTYRVEGLWVDLIIPWDIDMIWEYESLTKSNLLITNL